MSEKRALLDVDPSIVERNLMITGSPEDELQHLFPVTKDEIPSKLVKPTPGCSRDYAKNNYIHPNIQTSSRSYRVYSFKSQYRIYYIIPTPPYMYMTGANKVEETSIKFPSVISFRIIRKMFSSQVISSEIIGNKTD